MLKKIFSFFIAKDPIENKDNYQSLTPSLDADFDGNYAQALKVALADKNIKNIAITGSYGAGKSSFLRTFENNNNFKCLKISLANFQDKDKITNAIIEKSILQQIFYKEKSSKIPYSRFSKIYNVKYLKLKAFFLATWIVSTLLLFKFDFIQNRALTEIIKNFSFIIFVIGLFWIVKYLLQLISQAKLSNIKLKDKEINLSVNDDISILNKHLDEILYFFEVTDYEVIIFEDLDRFDNGTVFTKLRELNQLINNSDDINKRVIFIYAIKDDMFDDKIRTKFFDFIIPIVPYIHSSNSYNTIIKLFNKDDFENHFLKTLALYIDDMRFLKNIYNEYTIYAYKLGVKFNKNKLLAMIIYKNFYPSDFAKLHIKDGYIYNIFANKNNYIEEEISHINMQIDGIHKKLRDIENEKLTSIEDLRMIYLAKLASKLNGSTAYIINGNIYSLLQLLDNEIFDIILEDIRIEGKNNQGYNTGNIKFSNLDNNKYKEREKLIDSKINDSIIKLQEEQNKLVQKQETLKQYSIQEIIDNVKDHKIFDEFSASNGLIKYFLSNGYINEDYYNYISIFHEGGLTRNDRDFLLSVKDRKSLNFYFPLEKIEEIINDLSQKDFSVDAVLNYDLVEYLMLSKSCSKEFIWFLEKLADESKLSKKFVMSFMGVSKKPEIFIYYCAKYCKKLWFYNTGYSFKYDNRESFLYVILINADITDIVNLNQNNVLKNYISDLKDIKQYIIGDRKFREVIEQFNIKFKLLERLDNNATTKYIYENNHYEISIAMIKLVINYYTGNDRYVLSNLKQAHLTTLYKIKATKTLEYIEDNLRQYIENVFLKIPENIRESEEIIIMLLNHKNLLNHQKISIIKKEITQINDITKVIDKDLWIELLKGNMLVTKWDNLIYYYQHVESFDNVLIEYLNEEDNYKLLAKQKINNEEIFEVDDLKSISKDILLSEKVSDEGYTYLIDSVKYMYKSLSFEKLSESKILSIVDKKLIFTSNNWALLKDNFIDKHIILAEKFPDNLIKIYDELDIDSDDIEKILNSKKFTFENKLLILDKIDIGFLDKNQKLSEIVGQIYIGYNQEIDIEIFKIIIKNTISLEVKLELLISQILYLDIYNIQELFILIGGNYSDLVNISSKRKYLEYSELNKDLVDKLETYNYISSSSMIDNKIKVNRKRS